MANRLELRRVLPFEGPRKRSGASGKMVNLRLATSVRQINFYGFWRTLHEFARYFAHGEVAYGVVGDGMVKQLTTDPFEPFEVTDHIHPLSEVKLLAPCVPRKILAIGLNYSSHLHDRPGPDEPMVFYKGNYMAN